MILNKKAIIYRNSYSPIHSIDLSQKWILEFLSTSSGRRQGLMNWFAGGDISNQVRIFFPSAESAVKFADDNNIEYFVSYDNHSVSRKKRSYADNFIIHEQKKIK